VGCQLLHGAVPEVAMAAFIGKVVKAITPGGGAATTGAPLPPAAPWSDGIFSCFDDPALCFQTVCCYWCTTAQVLNKLFKDTEQFDPALCCGLCCLDYIVRGASALFIFGTRRKVIQRYNISSEGYCTSCVLGSLCYSCSHCQEQREMGKRGEFAGGFFANPPAPGPYATHPYPKPQLHTDNYSSDFCTCKGTECLDGWCCAPCTSAFVGGHFDAQHGLQGNSAVPPQTGAGYAAVAANAAGAPKRCDPMTCLGATCALNAFAIGQRMELAERYGLREDFITSCLLGALCPVCSTMQVRREIAYREDYPGGCCVKSTADVSEPKVQPPRYSGVPAMGEVLAKIV